MTGPEHYREAEAILQQVHEARAHVGAPSLAAPRLSSLLAEAQVHATLALAAATALVDETPRSDSHSEYRAWANVAGSDYEPEPNYVYFSSDGGAS